MRRRRSHSVSHKLIQSDSDSTDTCYRHINNTKKMVHRQHYKIKNYALMYIESLDREACCHILKILIDRHNDMSKYYIDYLSEFSSRFRTMILQLLTQKLMTSLSSSNLFDTPNLTLSQNIRDTLRLQSILNFIVSQSSLNVTVDIMNIIFSEYPGLFDHHKNYIHTIRPDILKILNRRK